MNKFSLTNEQLNRLLPLIKSDKELYQIFKRPVTNEEKIQRFIDTYSIDEDKSYILLGGYEYFVDRNIEQVWINDFMPNWKLIFDEIGGRLHFKDYYMTKEREFEKKLSSIGVIYNKEGQDEYDNLLSYKLPINKINDEQWVEEFIKIIDEYKTSFEEEMNLIYCGE